MMVNAESAGMRETAAAVEAVRRNKKASRRQDDGTEFCGVRRRRSGKYGAQIWDGLRRANVWLGTFGSAEEAAGAFDAAVVELLGAAKTNFEIPAAVQSSASVSVVKEETAQEQGLSAGGSCEIAEEHGGDVEAVERRGEKLEPDAQTKLENVHRYYRRTKDSRAGRNDGKTYRFFQQLEALHGPTGAVAPPAKAVGVPGMVGPSAVPPLVGATAGMATPVVGGNLSFSTSNTEGNSDDEDTDDMDERGKSKRSWEGGAAAGAGSGEMMRFFEGLMEQMMERQEAMQQRFVEAIEKREQDRVIREEAWRRQEMARLAREQEILAQERAMAATRNAAVVFLIQKITGQTIHMPSIAATPIRFMPPPPPSSQTHATPIAYAAAPPPSSQPPASTQPQPSPQPQKPPTTPAPAPRPQQQAVMVHQSSTDVVMTPRWPKAEVHALIQLRSNLDMRWKGPLWEEISAGMRRMGYSRSSKQCMVKWGSINTYFKKVKGSNKKRPEDSKTWPYFHQLDSLYRKKAALGSPVGAGSAAAANANAAPRDPIEAFTVAAPISQRAPQPHTGGSVVGNRFVFREAGGPAAANVHSRVATGGTYMWYPGPIADDINHEHVQAIGLKQAPVAAIRRTAAARSDSLSGYRGVRPYCGRYLAKIREPGWPNPLRLGTFDSVEEAARAYDAAALRLYGAAAKTNFEKPTTGATADALPELPVRTSTISAPPAEWQQVDEFLKEIDFTDVVA